MTLYPNLDYLYGECGNHAYVLPSKTDPKIAIARCTNMECINHGTAFQLELVGVVAVPMAPASPANQG